MRTRKILAFLSAGLILACCIMMYLIMDLTIFPPGQGSKLSVKDVSRLMIRMLQFIMFFIYNK